MPDQVTPDFEAQRRIDAPTLAECLLHRRVPLSYHDAAVRAFRQWLHSFHGIGESVDALNDKLRKGIVS